MTHWVIKRQKEGIDYWSINGWTNSLDKALVYTDDEKMVIGKPTTGGDWDDVMVIDEAKITALVEEPIEKPVNAGTKKEVTLHRMYEASTLDATARIEEFLNAGHTLISVQQTAKTYGDESKRVYDWLFTFTIEVPNTGIGDPPKPRVR